MAVCFHLSTQNVQFVSRSNTTAGFTAWSSARDPGQVFTLLEAVYGRFDEIAKKKGVFKVETIGDCYVAAAG